MTDGGREHVACNLCGADDTEPWARVGEAQLVRCRECGLVYTNPRPTTEALHASYEEDYQEVHEESELARLRRAMYALERADILRRTHGGRFLDVGCGTGEFLALVRDDFDVYGVDVSQAYVRRAREKLGLEQVQVGELTQVGFPEGHFDVVQMRGVIQHLPDPMTQAREAFRVTKPGGLLVLSATPNIESLCARLFRERHRLLAPDHMVFDFAPGTLRRLVEQAGYQVEEIVFPYVRTPYFRWWQPLGFVRLTTMLGLERVIPGLRFELKSPPFWGNMMTCYAMKPK